MSTGAFQFSIQEGNILTFEADVLAVKYAQNFYGTDALIAKILVDAGIASTEELTVDNGNYCYKQTQNNIKTRNALFVGASPLSWFSYEQIQDFAKGVLTILSEIAPTMRHLVMTIHGVGFGLDEIEAFLSQCKGYFQALQIGQFPVNLEKITIIDIDGERIQRLRQAFNENFANISKRVFVGTYLIDQRLLISPNRENIHSMRSTERIETGPITKPHVFVAMPFKKDMDDVFYYGIQQPVRSLGFTCERVDQDAFIGDILEQVKKKIETAAVVIAELSGANPNVYLEVGYAWGKKRPTILLVKNEQELLFDVRGQRCLKYETIKALEDTLSKELKNLQDEGIL